MILVYNDPCLNNDYYTVIIMFIIFRIYVYDIAIIFLSYYDKMFIILQQQSLFITTRRWTREFNPALMVLQGVKNGITVHSTDERLPQKGAWLPRSTMLARQNVTCSVSDPVSLQE
jgi:hypothetical protein